MELILSREPNDQAWELYEASFPEYERRIKQRHEEMLLHNNFMPYQIYEQGKFLGILYYWDWGNFIYLEHLATVPAQRGGGFGAKVLSELFERTKGKTIILEIDPPVTEIALRRQKFYERQGLLTNDHDYTHPSYRANYHPHKLVIMSYPNLIANDMFEEFKKTTLSVVP